MYVFEPEDRLAFGQDPLHSPSHYNPPVMVLISSPIFNFFAST
jgi:hypothetical protein